MATTSGTPSNATKSDHISIKQGLAYASPVVATTFLLGPIAVLQGIYAKYFGVALTTIAMVLFIGRLVDAITDPVIGYLSDRSSAKTGSRLPFILCGGVLLIISGYFLFVPTEFFTVENYDTTLQSYPAVSGRYFLVWLLLFYIAWTIFEIPHLAMGGELARDSQSKSKIYSLRALAASLGGLLFFCVPYLPWFDSPQITPLTLQWSMLIAGCLMMPLLYVSYRSSRSSQTPAPIDTTPNKDNSQSIQQLIKTVMSNRPFLLFATAFLFAGIGAGSMGAMYFFFIDGYLGLGDKFALISIVGLLASILCLGIWYRLSAKFGKKQCWGMAMIMVTICLMGFSLLEPGGDNFIPLMILMTLTSCGSAALGIIPASVLSDIVDYGTWRFGTDQAASYFSVYTLIVKANAALGTAFGLAIAGWFGFDAAATTHSDKSVLGLHLAIAYIPALFFFIATLFVFKIRISEKMHRYIRRQLDYRASKKPVQKPENDASSKATKIAQPAVVAVPAQELKESCT